ncbi:hypothetical protein MSAN_00550200 [Mycena sanguinolenta]|uniref:Uncharacterized protein n=1 Tax=Mycena sanguinolenta TaxID=230812 RepID=A0A8H7DJB1_9AGAR|nr:hypothetical protein MSAN_00550200 [Mycena sanguinolenta]
MSIPSSLTDWIIAQFSALYAPQQQYSNDDATPLSAFAPDAEFHLNHTRVDNEKFKEFVEARRAVTSGVECKAEDLIETPVEEGNAEAGSIVAGRATLVRTHPFLIRAAPMKTTTVISFSAKIKQIGDKPQIVELFQTSADKPVQITLQAPPVDASAL